MQLLLQALTIAIEMLFRSCAALCINILNSNNQSDLFCFLSTIFCFRVVPDHELVAVTEILKKIVLCDLKSLPT